MGINTAAFPAVTAKLAFATPFIFSPGKQNTATVLALSLISQTMPGTSLESSDLSVIAALTVPFAMTRWAADLNGRPAACVVPPAPPIKTSSPRGQPSAASASKRASLVTWAIDDSKKGRPPEGPSVGGGPPIRTQDQQAGEVAPKGR